MIPIESLINVEPSLDVTGKEETEDESKAVLNRQKSRLELY